LCREHHGQQWLQKKAHDALAYFSCASRALQSKTLSGQGFFHLFHFGKQWQAWNPYSAQEVPIWTASI
jgi:hypothetical protein